MKVSPSFSFQQWKVFITSHGHLPPPFFPFLLAPVEKGAVDFSGDVMIDFKHYCGHRANLSNVAMPYLRWESICSTDRKVVISRLCYLGHIRVTHAPPASNDSPLNHGSWRVSHAAQVNALACGSELDRGIPWSLSGAASSPGLLGVWLSFICHARHTPSHARWEDSSSRAAFARSYMTRDRHSVTSVHFSVVITVV